MKTKSVSLSGFLTLRVLASFSFGAMGLLLALLAFVALPKHSALANLGYCQNPDFYYEYYYSDIAVEIESVTQNKLDCIVFYTTDGTNPVHNGDQPGNTSTSRYYGAILVGPNQTVSFKALGYKADYTDSGVVTYIQRNPPD